MSARPADPLLSTAWLAEHLGEPDLRVLDASWFLPGVGRDPRAEYAQAHIPGAAFFDIDEIADPDSSLPHMLPTPAAFEAHMARLGVASGDRVVIYDAGGLAPSARAWWMLRAMGHEAVTVLDGGLPKWLAESLPIDADPSTPSSGAFYARPAPELVRDLDAVRQAIAEKRQVVDARPAARFRGEAPEPRPGLRGGHMPGALNVPAGTLLAADGTVLPPAGLERVLRDAGVDTNRPVIATCGSGITASLIALALARLGRLDAAVYDGSWAEWGARSDTLVVAP